MSLRVYLTGRMALETAEGMTDEAAFPGRQGRIAFAFLALSAQRPVARDVLADALWPDALPTSWDSALKSLVSKLRSLLVEAGVDDEPIVGAAGCYQLRLPVDAWVDLEACATAVDYAEGALRRGDLDLACSNGTVATAIARRPFLAGEDAPWIDTVRSDLRSWHVRALDVLAQAWIGRGNATLAVAIAADAVALEPFREPGYRVLDAGPGARRQPGRGAPHVRPLRAAVCRRARCRARSGDDRAAGYLAPTAPVAPPLPDDDDRGHRHRRFDGSRGPAR